MSKFYHTAQILIQKQPHLPRPLVRTKNDFFMPLETDAIPKAWIAQPHGPIDEDFLESFLTSSLTYEECRRIGFRELCHTPELIQRTLLEVSGTILSSHLAYAYGLATNVAGGTHHATATMGAGYTILNDLG
jgi:acetoin utilization deacetylase AcuC-like enzyme